MSTDYNTIIHDYLVSLDATTKQRDDMRNYRVINTVEFTINKLKTRSIKVVREHSDIVGKANANYINSGIDFIRVYNVILREHAERVNKETGNTEAYIRNRVIATIGYTSNEQYGYLLLSASTLTAKIRTSQGSELIQQNMAIATLEKAFKLAGEHGTYDVDMMTYGKDSIMPIIKSSVPHTPTMSDNVL